MNDEEIIKNNYNYNSLNASNSDTSADRLREKINAYKTNLASNSNKNNINNNLNKKINNAAATGLSAVGVPKPLADAIVKSKAGQKAINNAVNKAKKTNPALRMFSRMLGEDDSKKEQEGTFSGLEIDIKKVIKIAAVFIPVLTVIVFFGLILSSSNLYLKVIGLGHADSTSASTAEKKITDRIDKGINTEDLEVTEEENENVAFNLSIDSNYLAFRNSKLNQMNLVQTSLFKKTPKNNEATLDDLEDFYPGIKDLSEEYDEKLVYYFFLKMNRLYTAYDSYPRKSGDENSILDLPLLMATLTLQSDDMNEVFLSNLDNEERSGTGKNAGRKSSDEYYQYKYDWSWYTISSNRSTHDMEILAQHMVSRQVEEYCEDSNKKKVNTNILKDTEIGTQVLTCGDGETYKTSSEYYAFDNDKYKEYLKEFIEKKYYLNESGKSNSSGNWTSWKQCDENWGSLIVPKSKKTMCQIGCLITSVSIQIARSGTVTKVDDFNPSVSLEYFDFVDGGNYVWKSSKEIAPNFVYKTSGSLIGLTKQNAAKKLSRYDSDKYYIILAVSKKDKKEVHHYIALDYVDYNTGELYMFDPATTEDNVYNIYKVYNFYVYEKKD